MALVASSAALLGMLKNNVHVASNLLMIVEAKAQRAVNETIPSSSPPPIPATKTQN